MVSTYQLNHDAYGSLEYKVDIAIALGMDVLILSGSAASDETAPFQKLQEAGIELILIDGDVEESGRCAYVGTDNKRAGEQGAELFAERVEHCVVGILSSPVKGKSFSSGSRQERRIGFVDAVKQKEATEHEILIAADEICPLETAEATEKIEELLGKTPGINALFCLDSASAIAAAQAVRKLEKTEEIYVACFDMPAQVEEEMKKGGIDAALVQDSKACGKLCIEILKELAAERGSVQNRRELLECEIVTSR